MRIIGSLLILASLLSAQTQQLVIDAKNFEADDKKGISVFSGDVKIKMDKDILNAQKVEIFFVNKKGSTSKTPSKYVATGKVDFEIVSKLKHYVGNGDKIIYSPIKQEYTVIGNGFLQEKNDDRKIYGDKIYVNQLTGEARVNGSDNKPVRFIINIERGSEE